MTENDSSGSREIHRIIVTGGEQEGVLAALRGLRRGGYDPWVAFASRRAYSARSRLAAGKLRVPPPKRDAAGFALAVAAEAMRLSAHAVIPGTEACLVALAGRETLFPPGTVLACPSRRSVLLATDKAALTDLARSACLETPATRVMESRLVDRDFDMPFPVVVKPPRSLVSLEGGGQQTFAARRANDARELAAALAALPNETGLVQSFVEGRLTALAGVFWERELLSPVHFAADRTWPPNCGEMAYAVTVERDASLESAAAELLSQIGWSGLFQMQFLIDSERRYLIDLNPRIFTSLPLPIAAGANLPVIWMDALLGGRARISDYRRGVRYRSEERDVRALLHLLGRGNIRAAVSGAVPHRRTTHLVFSVRDPWPLLTTAEKVLSHLAHSLTSIGRGRSGTGDAPTRRTGHDAIRLPNRKGR